MKKVSRALYLCSGIIACFSVLSFYLNETCSRMFFFIQLPSKISLRIIDSGIYIGGLGSSIRDECSSIFLSQENTPIPYAILWKTCGGSIFLGGLLFFLSTCLPKRLSWTKSLLKLSWVVLALPMLLFTYFTLFDQSLHIVQFGSSYWLLCLAIIVSTIAISIEKEEEKPTYVRSKKMMW